MLASSVGHAEVIQMLLQEGADVAIKDRDGRTALMVAASTSSAGNGEDCESIRFLIAAGAEVSAGQGWGNRSSNR